MQYLVRRRPPRVRPVAARARLLKPAARLFKPASRLLFVFACAAVPAAGQSFAPAVTYAVGPNAQAQEMVLADFDGDGDADLATVNNSSATVSFMRNGGGGTFLPPVTYPTGAQPESLAAGDFNHDGKLDLIVIDVIPNLSTQSYCVLLGNGDGTFQPRVGSEPGPDSGAVAVGDFNGDGNADLVAAHGGLNTVSVRVGNGDGTLRAATFHLVGRLPRELVVGDFNGDGKPDVAAATEGDEASGAGVAVLLGRGDGTLGQFVRHRAATDFIAQLTAGDFNGDGHADLAATSASSNKISVLLGNGDGTFRPRVDAASAGSDKLAAADIDGDGKLDLLALRGRGVGRLDFHGGNGDGTLRPPNGYVVNSQVSQIAPADLNGDGKTDLVLLHGGSASVLINRSGPLAVAGRVTDQSGVALGGVTMTLGGGTPAVATTAADGSYRFAGLPAGLDCTVTPARQNYTFAPAQQAFAGLAADQSADFTATLLTFTVGGIIRDNSGAGVGGVAVALSGPVSAATTTGDDGRYSFTSVPAGGPYTVTPSAPRRVFSPPSQSFNLSTNRAANFGIALATFSLSVAVRDPNLSEFLMHPTITLSGTINRRADPINAQDAFGNPVFTRLPAGGNYTVTVSPPEAPFTNFVLPSPASQVVSDLAANQTLTFAARVLSFPAGQRPNEVAPADFDGDGRVDLLVTNRDGSGSGGGLSILLGNGDGTLQPPAAVVTSGAQPDIPVVGDFNADGKPDAAVTYFGNNNLAVFLGNGDGTLRAPVFYGTGVGPRGHAAADLNGDGHADLVTANTDNLSAHGVSVLVGNGDGTFRPAVNYPVGAAPAYVVTGDLNGDGKLDAVAGNHVLLGNGDGTLRPAVAFGGAESPHGAAVGDFNHDGKLDLAASGRTGSRVEIHAGNGDGTFRPALTQQTDAGPGPMRALDLDADGKLDLVAVSSFRVIVLMGNGDGTFADFTIYFFGNYNPYMVAPADLNNDGRPDLAFANVDGSRRLTVLLNQLRTGLRFAATTFSANEGDGRAQIVVTRGGDTSAQTTVNYRTEDNPAAVRCDTAGGAAFPRCDYSTTVDTLTFLPGETQKIITVPLVDDAHVEGNEILRIELTEVSGGTVTGARVATLTITDNDAAPGPNPISANEFFVRQQYLDFLSREPEPAGMQAWLGVLNGCANVNNTDPDSQSAHCDRTTVSAAFFNSAEFQLKGGYVFRFYMASLRRRPTYTEMISAMRSVTGQTPAEVFAKRRAFADDWVKRQDFEFFNTATNSTYVSQLLSFNRLTQITTPDPLAPDGDAKVTLTRDELIARLEAGALTRAQVLRAVVDSDEVTAAEFRRAFVAMQYFGYLRRDPEEPGFTNWLNYLDANPTDFRTMVNGFVNSTEYRLRFGDPNR